MARNIAAPLFASGTGVRRPISRAPAAVRLAFALTTASRAWPLGFPCFVSDANKRARASSRGPSGSDGMGASRRMFLRTTTASPRSSSSSRSSSSTSSFARPVPRLRRSSSPYIAAKDAICTTWCLLYGGRVRTSASSSRTKAAKRSEISTREKPVEARARRRLRSCFSRRWARRSRSGGWGDAWTRAAWSSRLGAAFGGSRTADTRRAREPGDAPDTSREAPRRGFPPTRARAPRRSPEDRENPGFRAIPGEEDRRGPGMSGEGL